MCQCRLPWQYRKIQEEVKYFSSVYHAIYQCFLSATDYLDCHPSMHVENNPETSYKSSNSRFKRNTYNSHEVRQYVNLSADETEYLSKLMVDLEKINKNLYWEISNIPSRQKHLGLSTWLFGWGMHTKAKS